MYTHTKTKLKKTKRQEASYLPVRETMNEMIDSASSMHIYTDHTITLCKQLANKSFEQLVDAWSVNKY